MVNSSDVKEGKGGDLVNGFGLCADGTVHPADEANAALPGGADPKEIVRYMREMGERLAKDEEHNGVERRGLEAA